VRWFATRSGRWLITGRVYKSDIRALLLGRNEWEVVVLKVRRLGTEPVLGEVKKP
jgi:hypothetical protein